MGSAAEVLVPHPDDRIEFCDDPSLDVMFALSAEEAEAYLTWLEDGEGTCPVRANSA